MDSKTAILILTIVILCWFPYQTGKDSLFFITGKWKATSSCCVPSTRKAHEYVDNTYYFFFNNSGRIPTVHNRDFFAMVRQVLFLFELHTKHPLHNDIEKAV